MKIKEEALGVWENFPINTRVGMKIIVGYMHMKPTYEGMTPS